jgi:hypothetical protein
MDMMWAHFVTSMTAVVVVIVLLQRFPSTLFAGRADVVRQALNRMGASDLDVNQTSVMLVCA